MDIKLIILDIGGVLFRKNQDCQEKAISKAAERYEISEDKVEEAIYNHFEDYYFNRTMSQYRYWKKVLSELGVDDEDLEKEFEYVYDLFNNIEAVGNEDIVKLVEKLAKKGYKLAVLSHTSKDSSKRIFNSGFIKYIDRVCLSHLNSLKKDKKQAFQDILDAFDIKPKETLFIDDKEKNLVAPEKLGIHAILYDENNHEEFLVNFKRYDLS